MAATAAWRDEMQGVACSQGLFSLTRDATQQFARQAPSHAGCGQIGRSLPCTAWHRSPGYDLRRTRRDLPDLTRNAAHGGINQRFLRNPLNYTTNLEDRPFSVGFFIFMPPPSCAGFLPVFRVPCSLRHVQKSRRFRRGSIPSCSLFSKNSGEPHTFGTRRTPCLPMRYACVELIGSTEGLV